MPTLRSQLDALAANFATQIVAAIQGASLHELVGSEGGRQGRDGRRAHPVAGRGGQPDSLAVAAAPKRGKNRRLPRRLAEEMQASLQKMVRARARSARRPTSRKSAFLGWALTAGAPAVRPLGRKRCRSCSRTGCRDSAQPRRAG